MLLKQLKIRLLEVSMCLDRKHCSIASSIIILPPSNIAFLILSSELELKVEKILRISFRRRIGDTSLYIAYT